MTMLNTQQGDTDKFCASPELHELGTVFSLRCEERTVGEVKAFGLAAQSGRLQVFQRAITCDGTPIELNCFDSYRPRSTQKVRYRITHLGGELNPKSSNRSGHHGGMGNPACRPYSFSVAHLLTGRRGRDDK